MDRAPVISILLLAAAASLAAEPPSAAPDEANAATAPLAAYPSVVAEPAVPEPAAPAVAETAAAPASAEAELADNRGEAPPAADAAPAAVPTVDIKKVADDTVCRKERPTGSLIGITRCYSRSAASLQNDELMRRDLEEMRMRQNEQQAREAAAAMTRRRVTP
ncbi:MAG TPA: hypothetical protein VFX89_00530 [Gammaproteobacteria bacterium]|nr:hypothetical protein [Gammaproteobacteria bacterium]